MRGKVTEASICLEYSGITPAYAGKSDLLVLMRICSKDHPCVCGEKYLSAIASLLNSGSPLRMRGKGYSICNVINRYRITPAYAGKS